MIKVEQKISDDERLIAFLFEASKNEDLEVLDDLYNLFAMVPNVRAGFDKTNVLKVIVKVEPPAIGGSNG